MAPATRRGFVPNAASAAFLAALPAIEARLKCLLDEDASRRVQEAQANDAKDLRRMFKRLTKSLPQYTLFDVADSARKSEEAFAAGAALSDEPGPDAAVEETAEPGAATATPGELAATATAFLFPPGPLAEARLKPARSVLAPLDQRVLVAGAHDVDGRKVTEGVAFAFRLDGPGTIEQDQARASRVRYVAPEAPGTATIVVTAMQGETTAEASAALVVRDDVESESTSGVPDPTAVEAPMEPWRSRLLDREWQYNSGHADYCLVRDDTRRRLRYLALLFAKEIVQRNFGSPMDGPVLERMVEVITHLDLADGKKERGAPKPGD